MAENIYTLEAELRSEKESRAFRKLLLVGNGAEIANAFAVRFGHMPNVRQMMKNQSELLAELGNSAAARNIAQAVAIFDAKANG